MSSKIKIGASSYVGEYLLPKVLGEWNQQSESTEVTVEISDSQRIFDQVISGSLDAGLIAACLEDERIRTKELVSHDELLFIVPPDHPLTSKNKIKADDLRGVDFVAREPGSATRMWYRERLSSEGLNFNQLNVVAELGGQRAVLSAVEGGAGVSFVPRQVAQDSLDRGSVVSIPIEGVSPLYGNLYMVCPRDRSISNELNHFLSFLTDNSALLQPESRQIKIEQVKAA